MITQALMSLAPGAQWSITDEDYSTLIWHDKNIPIPTKEQVEAEAARLQQEWDRNEYQRKRAVEYPDFRIYIDGLVKGDQEQMQSYIDACLDVKQKYPKPE